MYRNAVPFSRRCADAEILYVVSGSVRRIRYEDYAEPARPKLPTLKLRDSITDR
jgi:hypothetical protein